MKNWTLRQRILASFAVIIAIMLLMVVVSYSRLLSIESSEEQVSTDALPGLYYSNSVRSAWSDSYLTTLRLLGEGKARPLTAKEIAQFKEDEDSLKFELANYKTTVLDPEDQARFDAFEKQHQLYQKILTDVLDHFQANDFAQAHSLFDTQLSPAWDEGTVLVVKLITENKKLADKATAMIASEVTSAKISMGISLLVAVIAAACCGLLLMRAIMAPMQRIVQILGVMRTGDLSQRLRLERKDEFGFGRNRLQRHDDGADSLGVPGPALVGAGHHLGDRDRRHLQTATSHRHRNRGDHH